MASLRIYSYDGEKEERKLEIDGKQVHVLPYVGMDVGEKWNKKSDPNVGIVVAYQKGDILLSKERKWKYNNV